ncbi:MAG: DUF2214 family protein [Bacteroidales bacterium]|nr:DUF2214 family protein [Bacteroidales bacterium]
MNIFISYLHFIGIFILTGSLFAEYVLLRSRPAGSHLQFLAKIDIIYWISVLLVFGTGMLRWLVYDPKGADFFTLQHLFHIKVTLFLIVALLSIAPTLRFSKWKKKAAKDGEFAPEETQIRKPLLFIRIELLLIAIIPLLAVMVALNVRI